MTIINRKNFIKFAATSGLVIYLTSGYKVFIDHLKSKEPGFWNTDCDGTMVIKKFLEWKNRGVHEVLVYAKKWLNFHIEYDNKLIDDEFYNAYSGSCSRIIRGKYLLFTMYNCRYVYNGYKRCL